MSDKPKTGLVLAVDLSAIYFRNWVGGGVDTPVTQAKRYTLEAIESIKNNFPPETVCVICCDSRKNWRKNVDPGYKANREKQPDGFYVELQKTKERLAADGYNVLEAEGYEADDVIASLCKALKDTDYQVLICSPDKDLLQLVGPDVKQLRTHDMWTKEEEGKPRELKIWDDAAVLDYFGVLPQRLGDWQAITGDPTDNVPGIPRVGGKGAAALLAEFGTLNAMFTVTEACNMGGLNPFEKRPAISKWAKPLSEYFLGAAPVSEAIDRLAKNKILVSLKSEVEIDIKALFEPKKVKSITMDKDFEDAPVMEAVSMPPEVAATVDEDPGTTPTKALARQSDAMDQFDASLAPTGMRGLWWLIRRGVESRMYDKFGTEERALMAVQRGRDFGLSVTASLELLQIIEGRVCPPSQVLQAMCQRHPDCLYFYVKDVSPTSATAVTCRKRKDGKEGPEQTFTYTIEMAKQAKLIKPNGAWEKNPAAMCVARAASWLARWAYPDATTGAYSYEEMEGEKAA